MPATTMFSSSMCSVQPNSGPPVLPPTSVPSMSFTPALPSVATFFCRLFHSSTAGATDCAVRFANAVAELLNLIGRRGLAQSRVVEPRRPRGHRREPRRPQRQHEEHVRPRLEQAHHLGVRFVIAEHVREAVDVGAQQILDVRERDDVRDDAQVVLVRFVDDRFVDRRAQFRAACRSDRRPRSSRSRLSWPRARGRRRAPRPPSSRRTARRASAETDRRRAARCRATQCG